VDFSKPARRAFDYALALSQHHGAELVVLQAVPLNQPFSWHARERRAVATALRKRAEQAHVAFEGRIQKGDPAEIILLHARSLRPDVIVMGTHQRRGIDRLRVGSIAERVVSKAIVPVLLVPRRRRTGVIRPFSHVAVAVDFRAGTNRAVEQALALASAPGDRITLLHAVAHSSSRVPRHLYGYGIVESHDPVIRDARRRLQQLADLARRQTAAAIHTSVLLGDAAIEISRVVGGIGADLLVVGASKRGVVSRALFGTTAARLLRAIRVPMLAVPHVGTARTHRERASLQLAA
jgi:nucleotide-binding universal stress UspA family protein